ncbi:ankyrin [Choiromyces venosus 120613-1]|uniref:Ankyrin n=1 Tax=Choiromyces venosus 120613-1 TaxID=1336337 RepID=A0A3N4J7C3_9PEZI|nr:ankyrin [Choiromyces venosus 120613-1]
MGARIMSILDLPNELIISICWYLSPAEINNFSKTCLHFSVTLKSHLNDRRCRKATVGEVQHYGFRALFLAAKRCDENVIRSLLSEGIVLALGRWVLVDMVNWLNEESITSLLRCGIDAAYPDSVGQTPLTVAVWNSSEQKVRMLLGHYGTEANISTRNGQRPLLLAVMKGNLPIIRMLLGHLHIDINAIGPRGATALHMAVLSGELRVMELLLESETIDLNIEDEFSKTPLLLAMHLASESNKGLAILDRLVKDTRVLFSRQDRLPVLHYAACYAQPMITRILQSSPWNCDVNPRDLDQRTPLFYALGPGNLFTGDKTGAIKMKENLDVVLEDKRVDVNATDIWGYTPLRVAATSGNLTGVKVLLSRKDIDVNAKCKTGKTILAALIRRAQFFHIPEVFRTFLADPRLDVRGEYTALHMLTCLNKGHLIQILLRHPDVDVHAHHPGAFDDWTAIEVAIDHGFPDIVHALGYERYYSGC